MAQFSFNSLTEKVRQMLGGAGQQVSSNMKWAGNQAQQNVVKPAMQSAQGFADRVGSGLSNVQQSINNAAYHPNPLISTIPKDIISAGTSWSNYAKAPTFQNLDKAKLATGTAVGRVALAPVVGGATYLGSALIGGGLSAAQKLVQNAQNDKTGNVVSGQAFKNLTRDVPREFIYGAGQGVMQAPIIGGISTFTNPAIAGASSKLISKLPANILSKLSNKGVDLINRVIQGTLSIPEGQAIAKASGREYGGVDAALDFLIGAGVARNVGKSVSLKVKNSLKANADSFNGAGVQAGYTEPVLRISQGEKPTIKPGESIGDFQRRLEASNRPLLTSLNDALSNQDFSNARAIVEKMKQDPQKYGGYVKAFDNTINIMSGNRAQGGFAKLDEPIVGTGKTKTPEQLRDLARNMVWGKMSKEQFLDEFNKGLNNQNLTVKETAQKTLAEIKRNGMTPESFYDNYGNTIKRITELESKMSRSTGNPKKYKALSKEWNKLKYGELSKNTKEIAVAQKALDDSIGTKKPSPTGRIQNPLIEEAKKYKSAEEFVDSQRNFRDAHAAPAFDNTPVNKRMETGGDFNLLEVVKGKHNQPQDYFDSKVGPRYYMYDDQAGMESLTAINNVKRGAKTITAYRVVPKDVKVDKLIDNDWISFSKKYALDHGESRFGEGAYKIIKQEVPAKDVWWDGNDIREWGYDTGKTKTLGRSELTDIWNQANKGVEQKFSGFNTPITKGMETMAKMQSMGLPEGKYIALDKPFESPYHNASKAQKVDVNVKNVYDPDGILGKPTPEVNSQIVKEANEKGLTGRGVFEKYFADRLKELGYDSYIRNIDGQVGNRELIVLDNTKPKFSPTQMTREENVARNMLKKGDITPNQYNEIAVKNEGKVKPLASSEGSAPNQKMPQTKQTEYIPLKQAQAEAQVKGTPKTYPQSKQVMQADKAVNKAIQSVPSLESSIRQADINVKEKVGILDMLRTPDRVMKKIGLERESNILRTKYGDYLQQLPKEIDKVTEWSKRVPAESNVKIFKYLDGQKVDLSGEELKVANEIKQYLKEWAMKLNLPEDKRIASYITHIFEKDFIQKEFDPEVAKIIRDKVPGSVYDPFLEQRLGKQGYVEDTWRALDAYVKRATRKFNLDPALELVKRKSENLEESQFNYVKNYIDRINMRPTATDNLVDNSIKQIFGYRFGQRPVANLSKKGRQLVFRGALGINVGSALKNLSQGVNTYAKLGEKYTVLGYIKNIAKMASGDDELIREGVLKNDMIEDRTIQATKKFWEKLDKGLFYMFEKAEAINRGSAYFGAKSKALAEGMNEAQAIEYAKKIVRDTQFTFGSIDTPPILQGDLAKTILQFQSFSLKQAEFLTEMAMNKEYAGMIRYAIASLVFASTAGKLIGMDWQDFLPSFRFGAPPLLSGPIEIGKSLMGVPDKYGNVPTTQDKINKVIEQVPTYIPGGIQLKKTIQGLGAVKDAGSYSRTGKLQYPIPQNLETGIRAGLFGKSNLPQARWYFDNNVNVLGDKQTQQYKEATDKMQFYKDILQKREDKKSGITPTPKVKITTPKTKKPTLKLKKTSTKKSTSSRKGPKITIAKVRAPKVKKIKLAKVRLTKPLKLATMKISMKNKS